MSDTALRSDARRRTAKAPGRRTSVTGVLGEILITIGVVVMLYVVWQLWVGDLIYGAENNAKGAELSEQWEAARSAEPSPPPAADPAQPAPAVIEPIILPQPADTEVFGVMKIPRFGPDYAVQMAGGVTRPGTLDPIGIGHYPDTKMPGEVGNVALAAHRTTFGKPFADIANLQVGDAIVIETKDGWYTYRFRTLEYVTPDQVDVLLDVPQAPDTPSGERYLTMTSCSPKFSLAERIVGYSVFESFQPGSAGAPASLTDAVSA